LNPCDSEPRTIFPDDDRETPITHEPRIKASKRIAAALYHKMKVVTYLLGILLLCNLAHAQIESGTIIVFQFVNGKFIIAADSRSTNPPAPPNDTYCKITTFGNQLIVARTGGVSHQSQGLLDLSKTWDARGQINAALSKHPIKPDTPVREQIDAIADAWADIVKSDWLATYVIHPEQVRQIAVRQNGGLSLGIFALALGNQINITERRVSFADGYVSTDKPSIGFCRFGPCAAGTTDIFEEYISGKTERAAAERYDASPEVIRSVGRDMAKIIRLVDLAVAFDKSGTIGGKIDAVELSLGGGKRWLQRKEQCAEDDQ
jgi:hypothetical protein